MSREKEEMKNVRDEKGKRGNADAVPKKCEDGRLDADNDKDEETERCDGDVPRRRDQLGEAHTRMEDVSRPVRASHASTSGIRGNITKVHSMIEHCIVHGLRREETIEYLRNTVGVDRVFSAIVWDQLRAQNASFFANLDADDEPVHARYMHRGHMPQDYREGNHSHQSEVAAATTSPRRTNMQVHRVYAAPPAALRSTSVETAPRNATERTSGDTNATADADEIEKRQSRRRRRRSSVMR